MRASFALRIAGARTTLWPSWEKRLLGIRRAILLGLVFILLAALALLVATGRLLPKQLDGCELDIVMAQCLEDPHIAERLVQRFRAHGCGVTVHVYCKCGDTNAGQPLLWSTGEPLCNATLPNVGREGHSYLHHVTSRHATLAAYTLFLNGGISSKPKLQAEANILVERFVHNYPDVGFLDTGGFVTYGMAGWSEQQRRTWLMRLKLRQRQAAASAPELLSQAQATVAQLAAECSASTKQGMRRSSERCCHACGTATPLQCCRAFVDVCPTGQELLFDRQQNCTWRGSSEVNYRGVGGTAQQQYTMLLKPAGTANLLEWAAVELHIDPRALMQCGWAWGGTFIASREHLLVPPMEQLMGVMRGLEAAGRNGGLLGHYMERTWRLLFSACVGAAPTYDAVLRAFS